MKKTRVTKIRSPKDCFFCKNNTKPDYKDVAVLTKFLSERGKIVAHTKTGVCSKHQRLLTNEIKHARHVALLPFIVRV